MKKLSTLLCALIVTVSAWAQSPNGFSYQAVARDASGVEIKNTNVSLRISLLQSSPTGTTIYQETHSVKTNDFGLLNLTIGGGSVVTGQFATIDWGDGTKYVKVELDAKGGTSYQLMGTTQLVSVPYALHSATTDQEFDLADIKDVSTTGANDKDVLQFNGTSWEPGTVSSSSVGKLEDLSNVSTTSPNSDDVLKYNGTSWEPASSVNDLDDLADVSSGSAKSKDVLQFNGTSWEPASISTSSVSDLDDLSDVSSSSAKSDEFLKYDGNGWVPSSLPNRALGDLSNVKLSSTSTDDLLKWDGTSWINDDISLSDLSDASISSPSQNDVLQWNGSRWTAAALSGGSSGVGGSGSLNYMPKFRTTTSLKNSKIYDNDTSVAIGTTTPLNTREFVVETSKSMAGFMQSDFSTATTNPQILRVEYDGTTLFNPTAVQGVAQPAGGYGWGGRFFGGGMGVVAVSTPDTNTTNLVAGSYSLVNATSNVGERIGSFGRTTGGNRQWGLYGLTNTADTTPQLQIGVMAITPRAFASSKIYYAGNFIGDVNIQGSIAKTSGTFKIDHPLDPENKFLYHSFVESPDMLNIYSGNITTDADGSAKVELPEYFGALNKDFTYQLTVIGSFARAMVAEEVDDNHFVIKTDEPNVKVSWMVTGVRDDAYAKQYRVKPEVVKNDYEKGKYLHPEVFGKSQDKKIIYGVDTDKIDSEVTNSAAPEVKQ